MGAASCDCPDWKWPDAKSPQRTGNPGSAALSWQAPRLPLTGVGGPVVRLRMRVRAAVEEMTAMHGSALHAAGGTLVIPADDLHWQFVRSQGPGGQHVNRASTKAVLRFHAAASSSLPPAVRARLLEQQRPRLTDAGDLVITSQRFREQPRNIADCLAKLRAMLERAAQPPRPRRPTRPTRGSVARRRLAKQRRSDTKKLRKPPAD